MSVKVLPWKIFRPKREEVEKSGKISYSEGLRYACFSPNIIGVIKIEDGVVDRVCGTRRIE